MEEYPALHSIRTATSARALARACGDGTALATHVADALSATVDDPDADTVQLLLEAGANCLTITTAELARLSEELDEIGGHLTPHDALLCTAIVAPAALSALHTQLHDPLPWGLPPVQQAASGLISAAAAACSKLNKYVRRRSSQADRPLRVLLPPRYEWWRAHKQQQWEEEARHQHAASHDAWLHVTGALICGTAIFMAPLIRSATPNRSMLEASSTQLGVLCTLLPRLCMAVLVTTGGELGVAAAVSPAGRSGLQQAWADAILAALPASAGALSYISGVCPTGNACTQYVHDSLALLGLRLRLLAAAQHQRRNGRSCIAADALAAAVAAGTISGVHGHQQQQQQLPVPGSREPVPPHLRATLQQQPPGPMAHTLVPETVGGHIQAATAALRALAGEQEHQALVRSACRGYLGSLLQLSAELAALEADDPAMVCSAVSMAHTAVQLCLCAGAAAEADTSSSGAEVGRLPQAEVAVLLPTVLHLLSAAVLQALSCAASPMRQQPDADSASSNVPAGAPLTGDDAARLAQQFAGVVAAVVLSAEPKHLALAISKQPLRTLAALELAVRMAAAAATTAAAPAAPAGGQAHMALCLGDLLLLASTVAAACKAAASSDTLLSALTNGAAGSLVHNHMFSLLASCLKCCSTAVRGAKGFTEPGVCEAASNAAQDVAAAIVAIADRLASHALASPSSSSSSRPAAQGLWAHHFGRWGSTCARR